MLVVYINVEYIYIFESVFTIISVNVQIRSDQIKSNQIKSNRWSALQYIRPILRQHRHRHRHNLNAIEMSQV